MLDINTTQRIITRCVGFPIFFDITPEYLTFDISFYISIAALIITILFSGFQIYQNNSTYKGLRKFIAKPSEDERTERNEE